VKELDVANWNVNKATTLYSMFRGCQKITGLNVSNWHTGNVTSFEATFAYCHALTSIIGLHNWDTSSGTCFRSMFYFDTSLTKLDLSSFDTSLAVDQVQPSLDMDPVVYGGMDEMFGFTHKLQEVKFGSKFNFYGDGTTTKPAVLPVPSNQYIYGADGNWYTSDGTAYAPADIPNLTYATYYASTTIVSNVIWERDSKKYMHLAAMRAYHDLLNADIDTKFDTFREELGDYDISVSAIQTKASTEYTEEDAEIWIFNCGTSTALV
jgi:surface protein